MAVKPRSTDTCLIRTPNYYQQFALSRGKKTLALQIYLNTTRLIWTLSMASKCVY